MHRLHQAHRGQAAAVVLGGPSLFAQRVDLGLLRRKGFVVVLESKALTPYFLSFGIEPDYYLMLFPEKCVCNALQNFVFRSFLAQVKIEPYLKREYAAVVADMRDHFDRYFEPWRIHRGPHKRYRWRPGVFLHGSPLELLRRVPACRVIANRTLLADYFATVPFPNPVYDFEQVNTADPFEPQRYYSPTTEQGCTTLAGNGFLNSAAISLYPLLEFMGFQEVYFLGMDMTMLGSMEYAAPYTFKSLRHFRGYFARTNRVFNADFKPNRPFYFRPKSEFEDARLTLSHGRTKWIRVYEPSRYAAPLDGIPAISVGQFKRL